MLKRINSFLQYCLLNSEMDVQGSDTTSCHRHCCWSTKKHTRYNPVDLSIASVYRLPTISIRAEAVSISCNSCVVNSIAAAPLFSARRCNLVVPGMERSRAFVQAPMPMRFVLASHFFFCKSMKQVEQCLVGDTGFFGISW